MVAGKQSGMSSAVAEKRANDYLREFGLDGLGDRWPSQLSGGQRQRVAIAQQFMCSEHFLLLDEPFSGLDPPSIDRVCALVAKVANTHELNTIIVVTHDLAAALEVADVVWLLGRDRDERPEIEPTLRHRDSAQSHDHFGRDGREHILDEHEDEDPRIAPALDQVENEVGHGGETLGRVSRSCA